MKNAFERETYLYSWHGAACGRKPLCFDLKSGVLFAVAFLATSVHGDAIQDAVKEREYLDAMHKELDRRAQRTAPERTTLKVTANGQVYYVDAIDPGYEYNTLDDIAAAQKKARRQVYGEGEDDVEDNRPAGRKADKIEASREAAVPMTKGNLYFFSDTGIVAQKVKDGVLLWGRDDFEKGKLWRDANFLVLLRLKDTSKIEKGMPGGSGWFKYVGVYQHGSLFVGHRDVPVFEIPSKEEISQAESEQTKQRRIQEERYRFENEQRRIRKAAEKEKQDAELRRIQEENDRKIAEEKRKLEEERRKRELAEEKRRQEQAKKDEEELKRRYPIEQKARAEYASMKLGGISFEWKSYVRMQKDLSRYIYSIGVTEKKWMELKNLQRDKNWLGMLGAIAECEMKDYPDERRIDTLINKLRSEKFHFEIKFTHAIRVYVREPPFDARDFYEQLYHRGDCLFSFNIDSTKTRNAPAIMVYALVESHKGSVHEIDYAFGSKKNKIQSDLTLGRISQRERETALERANDEYQRQLSEWLETTPVRIDSDKPMPGREKPMASVAVRSPETGNNSNGKTSTKPKWAVCPDCDGTRYIPRGQCDKCGGSGKFRTPVTRGIGGRTMGGRITQCDKCKGKGEIKELCKRCRGNGKVRQ